MVMRMVDTNEAVVPERTDRMTFGMALARLRIGQKLQRAGWNGKGLYIRYVPQNGVTLEHLQLVYPVPGDGSGPYPQGAVVPWAPSQTDVLANDWRVVE